MVNILGFCGPRNKKEAIYVTEKTNFIDSIDEIQNIEILEFNFYNTDLMRRMEFFVLGITFHLMEFCYA